MRHSTRPERLLHPLLSFLPRLRNRHFLLIDILLLSFAPLLGLALRLEGFEKIPDYLPVLIPYTLGTLLIRLPIFYGFGLYGRYWRYATVDELLSIFLAVLVSTAAIFVLHIGGVHFGMWDASLPRSLPILSGLLVLLFVGGTRFSARLAYCLQRQAPSQDTRRVLIVGAGEAGQRIAKELLSSPQWGLWPIGFIDDDPHKQGLRIHNLPVLGAREQFVEVVDSYRVDQVLIAIPSAPGKVIREFVRLCDEACVPAKTLPSLPEILSGKVHIRQLRNVEIEDLLRREPVQTDTAAMRRLIGGKRVLITGAGGSIGRELSRQVFQCQPAALALLGHGENPIFDILNELEEWQHQQQETRNGFKPSPSSTLHAYIADIRSRGRIQNILEVFRPDFLFHAAAHKHVPLMEANPGEAVSNNIFGTKNLLDAALACGVEHFVMISTDKAVNPTSVMGVSKRVAELLVLQAARQSGRAYVVVRFGNVLGSQGSVVPIFKRQIAAGGPLTVSHPEMSRYFMTIPEAVQLVLQASVLGRGGEVFVLDMGEPIKIVDLARDLIRLSGLEVGRDIDIVYTGIRPGEKLFEELFLRSEHAQPTRHPRIYVAHTNNHVPPIPDEWLLRMARAADGDDRAEILRCLQELVPEFEPDEARQERREADLLIDTYAVVKQGKDIPEQIPASEVYS
jgi:FlaA1/EpsC-like NDP-sugar epimerase